MTSGRGAAFGDLFNNGKIDVVINPIDGPPVLLKNVDPDHHHWVELKLVGGEKGPRDAVCATVYLTANGIRQREDVMSGGSYISSNDQRPHFGLGDATDAGSAGDSLAFRCEGNGEATRGGSDLHDYRGERDHRRAVWRSALHGSVVRFGDTTGGSLKSASKEKRSGEAIVMNDFGDILEAIGHAPIRKRAITNHGVLNEAFAYSKPELVFAGNAD